MLEGGNKYQVFQNTQLRLEGLRHIFAVRLGSYHVVQGGLEHALFLLQLLEYWRLQCLLS